MDNKYLIMKCEELMDQFECDAYRTPLIMVDDWQAWYKKNHPAFQFEVWELKNRGFTCVKEYDCPMEKGMMIIRYKNLDENFDDCALVKYDILQKFPDRNRKAPIPKQFKQYLAYDENYYNIDNCLESCGSIIVTAFDDNKYSYAYLEYHDNNPIYLN